MSGDFADAASRFEFRTRSSGATAKRQFSGARRRPAAYEEVERLVVDSVDTPFERWVISGVSRPGATRSACAYLERVDVEGARGRLLQLRVDLQAVLSTAPEQDVRGWAVPVLDGVLDAIWGVFRRGEPAIARLLDLMSTKATASGAVRACDLYLVVGQVLATLPQEEPGGIDLLG